MASIGNDPGGRRRILFTAPDGKRKTVRLGKCSQRTAEAVRYRIERLLEAELTNGGLDPDTARWVADLPDTMAAKLARVGLIAPRTPQAGDTLQSFIEHYIASRVDVSPHTRRIWRQTARLLYDHFGPDRQLQDVTRGQAAEWRLHLVSQGLADATVRKHSGFAKHFFKQAVDRELIDKNPFVELVSSPVGNDARQRFVSREDTQKVIDACPDAGWRLIVVLSRYGGLRCPSEHLALKWGDVDWANQRIRVTSPKTARHAGHGERWIPLFPELRPYLEAVFDEAEPGTEYVINRHRKNSGNMRTQLARIIRRAGLTPWPRITHNLRASRATELARDFPAHVAAAWLGHSTLVAQKHYWTVGDEDFAKAVNSDLERGTESGTLNARNAAQQAFAGVRKDSQEQSVTSCTPVVSAVFPDDLSTGENYKTEVHGNRTHRRHG